MPLPPLFPSLAAIAVSLAGVVTLRRLGPALPRPGPAPVARGVAMDRFLLGLAGFALAQWGRGLLLRFLPAGSSPGVGYAAVGAGQLALAIGLASVYTRLDAASVDPLAPPGDPSELTVRSPERRGFFRRLGIGTLAYAAALAPILLVHFYWDAFQRRTGSETAPVQRTLEDLLHSGTGADAVAIILVATVAVPFFEEAVYRGGFHAALRAAFAGAAPPRLARALAVVASSALFTLVHDAFTWVPIFVLALVLGTLYERFRSLVVCIGFHAAHNATAIVWALLAAG